MKISILTFFALCVLAFVQANAASPATTYDKNNIQFDYPKSWKITGDSAADDVHTVFVEGPNDSIVVIQVYKKDKALSAKDYAMKLARASSQAIKLGKRSVGIFTDIKNPDVKAKGVQENFPVSLMGQTVVHVTDYYRYEGNAIVVFVSCQVAKEDKSKVKNGFDLVLKSFKVKG